MVMFIYRDDYYNKDTELKKYFRDHCGQQRNGPIGTIQLAWLPEYTSSATWILPSGREIVGIGRWKTCPRLWREYNVPVHKALRMMMESA